MVKPKSRFLQIFTRGSGPPYSRVLPILAVLTFISSWAAVYPARLVESGFARTIFPRISRLAGFIADAISLSWLDVAAPAALVLLVWLIYKRSWRVLLNVTAALYLIFFWSWGLNYHREPLASRLPLEPGRMTGAAMESFARLAAAELNRLYPGKESEAYDEARTRDEAARRVRRVVGIIDGTDWASASRFKNSRIGNPWLRAAGIDGVFNPIGHEPIILDTLLDVERPFVMTHELAHVRGYPDEGDANVIATFATLMSGDAAFQYSGWLNLWLYLRTRETEKLLDPGPRRDLQRIFDRARAEQVRWITAFQASLLDLFLKANNVDQGVRSYSRVVLLAAGTQGTWEHYR
jgi:uncharacterized protein DUF3810